MKKNLSKWFASVLIPVLGVGLFYHFRSHSLLETLEHKGLDALVAARKIDRKANDEIVVLLVDDSSLKAMEPIVGRWPWKRAIYLDLINFLSESGAKNILFDVLFTELQDPRGEIGELKGNDEALMMATASAGNVYHAFQILKDREDESNKTLLNRKLPTDFISSHAQKFNLNLGEQDSPANRESLLGITNKFYLPFTELYQVARGLGVVEFMPDSDGVHRYTKLVRSYQGQFFPVLSLASLLERSETLSQKPGSLSFKQTEIPLNTRGDYLINLYPMEGFETFSISGVMATIQALQNGDVEKIMVEPEVFQGKTIFIGPSAAGLGDNKLTAHGPNLPGVFLHASIFSNILDKKFIQKRPAEFSFSVFLVFAVLLGLLGIVFEKPLIMTGLGFLFTAGVAYLAFWRLDSSQEWFMVVNPGLGLFSSIFGSYVFNLFTSGREKKFLQDSFKSYISPELIDMMYESGQRPQLGGEEKVLSAYFTDIASFSTFSEKLTPTELVELLNEYLSAMTDILLEERGTLDKYEGDAIIAFFGAPLDLPDHGVRSATTAVRMQKKLLELREKWKSEGEKWPQIVHDMKMRIGINTGPMVTGNMGSSVRMNYTMMGDAVNLAARLEAAAKQYGVFTHISLATKETLEDQFLVREVDTVQVVGKEEPVTTFEVLDLLDEANEIDKKGVWVFTKGLSLYKKKKFQEAIVAFEESLQWESERLHPDKNPSKIYIERCLELVAQPPAEDWEPVVRLNAK